MAFFLVEISKRKCQSCGASAFYELKSSGTVSYGDFCRVHGMRERERRNLEERTGGEGEADEL